jgi:hypothetical protein
MGYSFSVPVDNVVSKETGASSICLTSADAGHDELLGSCERGRAKQGTPAFPLRRLLAQRLLDAVR